MSRWKNGDGINLADHVGIGTKLPECICTRSLVVYLFRELLRYKT